MFSRFRNQGSSSTTRPTRPRHRLEQEGLRLSDLQPGEYGRILEIGGSEQFRIRLMEMGLLLKDTVEVDKFAPLQDPMELIVKGYHLSLRLMDAEKIRVERVPAHE
jgi:Fe2+ transport system protein FeoA